MNATSPRTRVRPDPLDLTGIDDMLSTDEKAVRASVRASVRALCASSIAPYTAEWFESGGLPGIRDLAKELGGLGLLGMHWEHGTEEQKLQSLPSVRRDSHLPHRSPSLCGQGAALLLFPARSIWTVFSSVCGAPMRPSSATECAGDRAADNRIKPQKKHRGASLLETSLPRQKSTSFAVATAAN